MWTQFFFGLFVATLICAWFIYQRQQREIESLQKAREKIQTEEDRVFDFLHGLGAAFTDDFKPANLHRLIVEGAMQILDAQGGTLYMVNEKGTMLIPSFISKGCPPLLEVPQHILQQAEATPVALQSYLRLHAVAPGEGLIGRVWKESESLLLTGEDQRLDALRDVSSNTESAMLCPLRYGNQTLGVLALANGPMSNVFTKSDFAVFKAISEQSAFALYNAIIYSQANEKKRLDHDLRVAHDIQRILLNPGAPALENYEISGTNIPARQVSGDYFDYVQVDQHRWGVAIADVSGKGVPASLIMAMCRSVLRTQAAANLSPADVLRKVNRYLYPDIREDMFISMAYAILDDRSNEITMCRAGHDAPLLYSAREQTVVRLNPPGMALGIDRGDVFDRITNDFSVTLEQNDCLILYTDGVTEALDSKGFEFGINKTIQSIQASAPQGAAAIVRALTEELRNFIGSNPQNDDVTLIVIRKK